MHTKTLTYLLFGLLALGISGVVQAGGIPASDMSGKGSGSFMRYTSASPVASANSGSSKGAFSFYNAKDGARGTSSVPLFQQARSLSVR
jgi:hypothetical protein